MKEKLLKVLTKICKCWLIGHNWIDPIGTYTRNSGTGGSGSLPFYCQDCGKLSKLNWK